LENVAPCYWCTALVICSEEYLVKPFFYPEHSRSAFPPFGIYDLSPFFPSSDSTISPGNVAGFIFFFSLSGRGRHLFFFSNFDRMESFFLTPFVSPLFYGAVLDILLWHGLKDSSLSGKGTASGLPRMSFQIRP